MEGHTTCPETDCCFTLVEQPNPSFEASYWSRDKNVQKSKYQTYKGLVETSVLRAKNSAKHLSLYVQKDKGPQKPSYTRQESWPKTLFGPHVLWDPAATGRVDLTYLNHLLLHTAEVVVWQPLHKNSPLLVGI